MERRRPALVPLALALTLLAGCTTSPDVPTSPPAPPASPAPAPDHTLPVGDLPGWRQVFADDFTTDVPRGEFPAAVSSRWWAYPDGWRDTSRNGVYSPSTVVSVTGGVMNLHLHTDPGGVPRVAAPVPNVSGAVHTNSQLYGRYSIRFRADPVSGYKTAWLLWPDSEAWPRDGEINFPEGPLDGRMCAFVHHQGGRSKDDQDGTCTAATYTDWHTATIEWMPGRVTFVLDGVAVGTITRNVPNTPMHWVIQTETRVEGGRPDPRATGNVQIDWVAIYAPVSVVP